MKHNWEYRRLDEVCEIVMGQSPDSASYNSIGEGLPFFQGSSDFGEITPEVQTYCTAPTRLAEGNDILFSVRAPIGSMNFSPGRVCIGRGLAAIRAKNWTFQRYIYYILKHTRVKIEEKGTGSTFKAITKAVLHSHIIPVPPMEVQQQIVAELDKLNEAIATRKEQLKELDNLAQSLFYDTFGDPVTNPKGWPLTTLGAISEKISNGCGAKIETDTYKTEGIAFFRCQNVWKNHIDYSDIVYVDEEFNTRYKSSSLKHNDLIVTKIGRLYTENTSLGRVSLYPGKDYRANLSGNLSFIRLLPTVSPKFVLYIMISDYFKYYVRNTTSGGIDKRALNNSQLKAFSLYLPPLPLQQRFASQVEAIERQKETVEASIADLQTLLDSRMDYWFN